MQIQNNSTASPTEPITEQDLRSFARIASSESDPIIGQCILAARTKAEQVTGRSVVAHSFIGEVRNHEGEIELFYPTIGTIDKVEYFDGSDWVELVLNTDYLVHGLNEKSIEVSIAYQNVRIEYTTLAIDNWDVIRHIKELATIYYDNRPDASELERIVVKNLSKYKICQVS